MLLVTMNNVRKVIYIFGLKLFLSIINIALNIKNITLNHPKCNPFIIEP